MTHRPFYHTSTRREALRNMAAVGGLAAAGSVVAPGLFSTPAAAAAGNQLIVAVSATPVSLDPEYGASLESWELPVFIYEYLFCYYFKKGADGVGLPQFEPPYEPRLAESVETSADGKTADVLAFARASRANTGTSSPPRTSNGRGTGPSHSTRRECG